MLLRVASLNAYELRGLDGDIGGVQEFYFDDQCWTIRYVAAATGTWLGDKHVLISPSSAGRSIGMARTNGARIPTSCATTSERGPPYRA